MPEKSHYNSKLYPMGAFYCCRKSAFEVKLETLSSPKDQASETICSS